MKSPRLQDDAFLADLASVRSRPAESTARPSLSLWWLGQSGYLIHHAGHTLLLDPYLSDSLTRKYATTDKPHVRMTARVVAPERLTGIEVVTASHVHTDHLDPETLRPLVARHPDLLLVCPESIRDTARERSTLSDDRIVGLDVGGPAPSQPRALPSGIEFHAIPAAHESLDRDVHGRLLYLGFIVRVGPFTIYHSGDTVQFAELAETVRPFAPDVALLPINGRGPERRVAGNLWGREAASLAKEISARLVIPCHYDMFEFNTATPAEFVLECQRLGQPYRVLEQGERHELTT